MHFSIYLDDDTGQQLNRLAQQRGQTRNALIRRALVDWVNRQQGSDWPAEIVNFSGCPDWAPFESHRDSSGGGRPARQTGETPAPLGIWLD